MWSCGYAMGVLLPIFAALIGLGTLLATALISRQNDLPSWGVLQPPYISDTQIEPTARIVFAVGECIAGAIILIVGNNASKAMAEINADWCSIKCLGWSSFIMALPVAVGLAGMAIFDPKNYPIESFCFVIIFYTSSAIYIFMDIVNHTIYFKKEGWARHLIKMIVFKWIVGIIAVAAYIAFIPYGLINMPSSCAENYNVVPDPNQYGVQVCTPIHQLRATANWVVFVTTCLYMMSVQVGMYHETEAKGISRDFDMANI